MYTIQITKPQHMCSRHCRFWETAKGCGYGLTPQVEGDNVTCEKFAESRFKLVKEKRFVEEKKED